MAQCKGAGVGPVCVCLVVRVWLCVFGLHLCVFARMFLCARISGLSWRVRLGV